MIKREQFTAWDWWTHPECANSSYLEYEMSQREDILTFGYKEIDSTGRYKWVTIEYAKNYP